MRLNEELLLVIRECLNKGSMNFRQDRFVLKYLQIKTVQWCFG